LLFALLKVEMIELHSSRLLLNMRQIILFISGISLYDFNADYTVSLSSLDATLESEPKPCKAFRKYHAEDVNIFQAHSNVDYGYGKYGFGLTLN